MGYFAGRAAPLGAVGPGVVTALFYNFAPAHVARALPDAWDHAPPATALRGATAGGGRPRCDGSSATASGRRWPRPGELAGAAARTAPPEGRALFAANAALDWPDEPLGALWHAATLLREHRGDGHVAVLTAAGVTGREANVLHAASGATTRQLLGVARQYDDAEWDRVVGGLAERGLLTADGTPTEAGRAVKQELEDRTDQVALCAYAALDDGQLQRLLAVTTPIARAVVAAGDLPAVTPMGATFELS